MDYWFAIIMNQEKKTLKGSSWALGRWIGEWGCVEDALTPRLVYHLYALVTNVSAQVLLQRGRDVEFGIEKIRNYEYLFDVNLEGRFEIILHHGGFIWLFYIIFIIKLVDHLEED
jgi:hypothetical protein